MLHVSREIFNVVLFFVFFSDYIFGLHEINITVESTRDGQIDG